MVHKISYSGSCIIPFSGPEINLLTVQLLLSSVSALTATSHEHCSLAAGQVGCTCSQDLCDPSLRYEDQFQILSKSPSLLTGFTPFAR